MKKRLSLFVLTAFMTFMVVFVGTAYAYYDWTGPIDSQMGDVGIDYLVNFPANITSWYHIRILPAHTYEWEWITFEPAKIFCSTSTTIFIGFESYITIKSFALTKTVGEGSSATTQGGVGYSWLQIYINGSSFWDLTLTTNYISSDYWGSITPITLSATAGGDFDATTVYLQI